VHEYNTSRFRHDTRVRMTHSKPTRTGSQWLGVALVALVVVATARAQSEASPAAQPIPATRTPQTFAPELVDSGRIRFAADCGFCDGRDAAGGTLGSDLTRSELVADDVGGDRIGQVVRTGRVDAGMPSFATIDAADLAAIVAFIHDQKAQAEAATGGRRSVELADLATGDAEMGQRYFQANCSRCHSAGGDLAGIATRLEGLALLRRMLYPGSEGPRSAPTPPSVSVSTPSGERVSGALAYRDEFTIALVDAAGRYRSWPTQLVDFEVDDPLEAHVEQLARYTDTDMHNVLAFLHTLR